MKKTLLAIFFLISVVCSSYANSMRVIAFVNDDIISSYDFSNRISLSLVNYSLENNEENIKKLSPVVINELILETLKKQAAFNSNLSISEEEVDNAILSIAKSNNMSEEEFKSKVFQNNNMKDSFIEKLKSDVLWNKYVSKTIAPRVNVLDKEIEDYISKNSEEADELNKDKIKQILFMKKINLLQERKIRDLRDSAFIEVQL
ncbi:MAG: SurA N-terminal domain-containing protein [Alphaproteobacteria bacterium]|jgi:peptidyl-prolyl cis-trans isomerase SurA|nr:SurA N-terminal domain-containing protein [Alphaproteobacteria bacterium]